MFFPRGMNLEQLMAAIQRVNDFMVARQAAQQAMMQHPLTGGSPPGWVGSPPFASQPDRPRAQSPFQTTGLPQFPAGTQQRQMNVPANVPTPWQTGSFMPPGLARPVENRPESFNPYPLRQDTVPRPAPSGAQNVAKRRA